MLDYGIFATHGVILVGHVDRYSQYVMVALYNTVIVTWQLVNSKLGLGVKFAEMCCVSMICTEPHQSVLTSIIGHIMFICSNDKYPVTCTHYLVAVLEYHKVLKSICTLLNYPYLT